MADDLPRAAALRPSASSSARAAAEGLVARLRKRMFEPLAPRTPDQPASTARPLPAPTPARREVGFQASVAEFLLINRLRARRKAVPSADVLERGAKILQVTCKHWFASAKPPVSGSQRRRL